MGYLEGLLSSEEEVLFTTRSHWTSLLARIWFWLLVLALCVVVAIAVAVSGAGLFRGLGFADQAENASLIATEAAILLAIVSALFIFIWYVVWRAEMYVVSNFRIIRLSGILSKSSMDSSLEKVNDVALYQSFLGRIMDFGNLEILTASEIGVNKLVNIGRPVMLKKVMLDAKQRLEGLSRPVAAQGIADQLSDLASLRDRGVITEDEFQRGKQEILNRS